MASSISSETTRSLSYLKRASLTRHPMAQKLFKLMQDKKTNLAVALDYTSQSELLAMADKLGPYVCMIKTHVDILTDYTSDFGTKLQELAKKHQFLIFEDRKFADIGQTVSLQYHKGIYRISEWADIVNAHPIAGPGVIDGLKGSNLLLLAEMSSSGTLAKGGYTKEVVAMAEKHPETVMGFISLGKVSKEPNFIHCTPGVQLEPGKDSLGQRYRTVEEVIQNGTDVIIVGRGITHAEDPVKQSLLYQQRGWDAYTKSL